MEYSATVDIDAPIERIWALLTNASDYPRWNTTVVSIEGEIAEGSKIRLLAKISPDRAFTIKIAELREPDFMRWTGGMPLGLFRGDRTFRLEQLENGKVRFTTHEIYTGLLKNLIAKSMPDLQPSFDEWAASLKREAEG